MKIKFTLLMASIFLCFRANAQCWKSIDTGYNFSVAIKSDGTLWAWGHNNVGQLGDGSFITRYHPVQIGTDANWESVMVGIEGGHVIAYKTDGTIWGWGGNTVGQLGFETILDTNVPMQIGSTSDWQTISVGSSHCLALKHNGTLWAWGWNYYGQLGDGTKIDRHLPVQIGTDTNWLTIACGSWHSFGIKTDGTLWAWGLNDEGQLGDGSSSNKKHPQQIGVATNWQKVFPADYHTLAQKTDGTLWGWGDNYFGQLGDGTIVKKYHPVQVSSDTDWQFVTGGYGNTMAIKTDGSRWGWGWNYIGQLGDGTSIDKIVPTLIDSTSDWQSISPDFHHTLFLETDGTLWATGENYFGALGTGTDTDELIPVEIACPIGIIADDFCTSANDINLLFGKAPNVPQVSVPYHNIGYTNTDDPSLGFACWKDGPSLNHSVWFTFEGDGNTYRIRPLQCNNNEYIDDSQAAIYTGGCGNLTPNFCEEDQDAGNGNYNFNFEVPTSAGTTYYMVVDGAFGEVGRFCLEVTNLTISSATLVEDATIGLHPNPTNGLVHLGNMEADQVFVFDNMGRLVLKLNEASRSIDLSEQPAGIYFLKITKGKAVHVAKIVKE